MPGGEIPTGVGNTSGDAGAHCAPARPQHRGDNGGGKPPPTTVPLVRPPGLQEGAQRAPPGDHPVQDGYGAQEETAGGGGDAKMSPTIFNVVVDAVIRHWIDGIVDEAEEKGETGREGQHQ